MNEELFNTLLKSVEQAGKISRGTLKAKRNFHYREIDVKLLRKKIGLTQINFATMIGVSVRTLQNWEQGYRKPEGPALALLTIFKNNPEHAFIALHQANN
ncbi:MAG: DNA-binding protein [Francisellaceae bacterium]|nr:DNA-binding protein [Francisellaceae bacterium]